MIDSRSYAEKPSAGQDEPRPYPLRYGRAVRISDRAGVHTPRRRGVVARGILAEQRGNVRASDRDRTGDRRAPSWTLAAARSWYRRTLGRRRDRYDRLARLGTGAQLSFFTSVLGEPPAIRRTIHASVTEFVEEDDERFDIAGTEDVQAIAVPAQFTECLFIDRDYYLQTISDSDETVLAFSVTTRSKRFTPTFRGLPEPTFSARVRWRVGTWVRVMRRKRRAAPDDADHAGRHASFFKLKLGRTRFHEASSSSDPPKRVTASYWPRGFAYSEVYYFGNPGYYLHHVFTASNVAGAPAGSMDFVPAPEDFEWPPDDVLAEFPRWHEMTELHRFRSETAITTYTVIGSLLLDDYPTRFGPHGDEVRTLP